MKIPFPVSVWPGVNLCSVLPIHPPVFSNSDTQLASRFSSVSEVTDFVRDGKISGVGEKDPHVILDITPHILSISVTS